MPLEKLKEFLDKNKVKYVTINHSPAYTAQEIAEISHVSAKKLAKCVIAKIDDKLAMVVLPGDDKVDFDKLKQKTGAHKAELASEYEFQERFPGCELGAMPPFGNLFDMKVYLSKELSEEKEIVFNAGTHSQLLKLSYEDYEKLVKPTILST
ncbi:aminoacyl-tRNA deacylase [Coxiella burnetii]|uniref:aminoacyl-tRNA deacylase n=1 Tax=Coxiella burnetii TaxID=777 RepID=UPI0000ECFE4F|nr:YbaK/EbsC family protein [Coxiella burnetii]ACJ19993.1 hypothetical cytosolic protein [Coxiella burnetii CbuK_Q154]AIT63013.1 YbaK/prolyl-tRNA synthetase associated region [Coxiella burnetii str. Namibia]ATN85445.1 deacylase [Coxiella burnetii str. Schperling]EAX32097.1 deacylase [Coxiella burnetii 'MSU Goat Q177']EDR36379.1 YbaK/prolyl-tRNA synthetase domain protein [Coxiella burnetii Q321]